MLDQGVAVLFELGTEELPSSAVKSLAGALLQGVVASLEQQGLCYEHACFFATPRRLAIRFFVESFQQDQTVVRRGPAYAAGLADDGQPTPALQGFAKSCGVAVDALQVIETEKGRWWSYEAIVTGRATRDILPGIIQHALSALPMSKPMHWGSHEFMFARPVHWAVLLYGEDVIEMDLFGCHTDRNSFGHRFHHPEAIVLNSPMHYEQRLFDAQVIVDFKQRREKIVFMAQECVKQVQGEVILPEALLDEVTSIVEWPQALLVPFDARFLDMPAEVLIEAMQVHQKCFALRDSNGHLLPYFVAVSNIESREVTRVIEGNARVMRARLSDAAFFYHQDQKQNLKDYAALTAKVVFQSKLGSLQDKAMRVEQLMSHYAVCFGLDEGIAARAAQLSKADLMTAMVNEFPELQGIMGYYYAKHDGESEALALALNEQYWPRFSKDALPTSMLGRALSLMDRVDTLVGIFAVGLKPTGDKDPFKLRRHALAIVRILKETETVEPIDLNVLFEQSMRLFETKLPTLLTTPTELLHFVLDRLPASYQESYQEEAVDPRIIQSVRGRQERCLFDLHQRVFALQHFLTTEDADALIAAAKRVRHLLHQAQDWDLTLEVDTQLLEKPEEQHLFHDIQRVQREFEIQNVALTQPTWQEYERQLKQLASLRLSIDAFFASVMVMVEDQALKYNRLRLLSHLQNLLETVSNLSILTS